MNSSSKHPRTSDRGSPKALGWAARASSIGMQMAVPPGLGVLADRHFQTSPWLTVVGVCLGFVLAMLDLSRLVKGETDRGQGETGNRRDSASTTPTRSPTED